MAVQKNTLNMNELLELLNKQFSINDTVVIKQFEDIEKNILFYIEVNNKFSSATIQLQGAHLTKWNLTNSEPIIWLSDVAKFILNKSIRGGIPVCWPWFGAHQTNLDYPAHGFARTQVWQIESIETIKSGETRIILSLSKTNMPETQWSYESHVECIFTIGQTLDIELITYNHSDETIVIGEAFHTYFNVSNVRNILIDGLEECEYLDKLDHFNCKTQEGHIEIKQEVDRVYIATDHDCTIEDLGFNRRIRISKKDSLSTIVWNPWLETATKMGDLGDDGYLNMICVESGNAAQDVVTIKPDEKHSLCVQYTVEQIT